MFTSHATQYICQTLKKIKKYPTRIWKITTDSPHLYNKKHYDNNLSIYCSEIVTNAYKFHLSTNAGEGGREFHQNVLKIITSHRLTNPLIHQKLMGSNHQLQNFFLNTKKKNPMTSTIYTLNNTKKTIHQLIINSRTQLQHFDSWTTKCRKRTSNSYYSKYPPNWKWWEWSNTQLEQGGTRARRGGRHWRAPSRRAFCRRRRRRRQWWETSRIRTAPWPWRRRPLP